MRSEHCTHPVWDQWTGELRFCQRPPQSSDIGLPLCLQHEHSLIQLVRFRDDRRAAERLVASAVAADEARRAAEPHRLVYYVRRSDGAIKIGSTGDLTKRLRSLRLVSPVEVLATHAGGYAAEKAMHRRFREHRLDGEWFAPAARLLDHIALLGEQHSVEVAA